MEDAVAVVERLVATWACGRRAVLLAGATGEGTWVQADAEVFDEVQRRTPSEGSNPYVALLLSSARSVSTGAACGWRCAALSAYLLRALMSDVDAPLLASRRASASLDRLEAWLGDLRTVPKDMLPCRVAAFADWQQIAETQLRELRGSEAETSFVATAVVRSIVLASDAAGIHPERVHLTSQVSSAYDEPLLSSLVIPGVVLDFQFSLESQLVLTTAAHAVHRAMVFTDELRACCHGSVLKALVERFGVTVIFSQRVIEDVLRYELGLLKVITVERLSIRHVARVAAAIGCYACPAPTDIARLSSTHAVSTPFELLQRRVGGKHAINIVCDGAVTLVIGTSGEHTHDAFEATVRRCISQLAALMRHPHITDDHTFDACMLQYLHCRQALSPPRERLDAGVLRSFTAAVERRNRLHGRVDGCPTALQPFRLAAAAMKRTAAGCYDADGRWPEVAPPTECAAVCPATLIAPLSLAACLDASVQAVSSVGMIARIGSVHRVIH
jgi:hypothetical protein